MGIGLQRCFERSGEEKRISTVKRPLSTHELETRLRAYGHTHTHTLAPFILNGA